MFTQDFTPTLLLTPLKSNLPTSTPLLQGLVLRAFKYSICFQVCIDNLKSVKNAMRSQHLLHSDLRPRMPGVSHCTLALSVIAVLYCGVDCPNCPIKTHYCLSLTQAGIRRIVTNKNKVSCSWWECPHAGQR